MKQTNIQHPESIGLAVDVFESSFPIIMIELRSVYGLIAPNTPVGILALNECKQRKPGKHYGSITGNAEDLARLAQIPPIPYSELEGFILRLPVREDSHPSVSKQNTHQVLFDVPVVRNFITSLEHASNAKPLSLNFCHSGYAGPLCTSANMSGDISGSITLEEDAIHFGRERAIPLLLQTGIKGTKRGSYPIFSFNGTQFAEERNGPDAAFLLEKLNRLLLA